MKTENSVTKSKDKWLGTCFFRIENKEEEEIKKKIKFLRVAAQLAIEELFSEVDADVIIKTEFKKKHVINELYLPAEFYNRRIACMVREQNVKEYNRLVEKMCSNFGREDLYDETNS